MPTSLPAPAHRSTTTGPARPEPSERSVPRQLRLHLVAALGLLAADGAEPDAILATALGPAPRAGRAALAEPFVRVIAATVSRPPADDRSAALVARVCADALVEVWSETTSGPDGAAVVGALFRAYRRTVRAVARATGASVDDVDLVCTTLVSRATSPG